MQSRFPMDDLELTHEEEGRGDDLRADQRLAFTGQCPALNAAGEHCSHTAHTLHRHTWETP